MKETNTRGRGVLKWAGGTYTEFAGWVYFGAPELHSFGACAGKFIFIASFVFILLACVYFILCFRSGALHKESCLIVLSRNFLEGTRVAYGDTCERVNFVLIFG